MKIYQNRLFLTLALLFIMGGVNLAQAQPALTAPGLTACPCQTVLLSPTWNNVSGTSYTLIPFPPATPNPTVFTGATAIANCTNVATVFSYSLIGSGIYQGNPIAQTITVTLNVQPPAPLVISSSTYYCTGDNAVLTAPLGGTSYTLLGPASNGVVFPSNVITLPGVTFPSYNGQYTVNTVMGGCSMSGVTSLSIVPVNPVSVNTTSNICLGNNQQVVLTAFVASGVNYNWSFNTNIVSTGSPNYTFTPTSVNQSGAYQVVATYTAYNNNKQCTNTATTQVNLVATSPVQPVASPKAVLCQGSNLILTANAPNANSFSWQGPSYSSTLASPVISNLSGVNSGVYTVSAFFNSPFLTCVTTETLKVTVVLVSQPQITLAPTVCQGDMGVFGAVSTQSTGFNYSFNWTGPAPAMPPGGNFNGTPFTFPTSTMQPNYSGVYYVTATFQDNNNITQCVTTASAQLSVITVNTISVVPPGLVCSPDNAFLQSYSPGANSYVWSGPNGFAQPGANVWVYHPTPANNGIYTVTAYFGGGNITCPKTNTLQLTVNTPMTFSLEPWYRVCYNDQVTINGPIGATGYTWTSSTGFTSNNRDAVFPSIQPANAGTYTLTIASGPCKTTNSTFIDVVSMINFSLVPSNRTICRGDTIVLEAGVQGGSNQYAYAWNPPLYLSGIVGPRQVAIPEGSITYYLVVHDIACPSFSLSQPVDVNVIQPPLPAFSLTTESGCAPLTVNFKSGLNKEDALVTYDFGKGDEGVIQGVDAVATWVNPGTYNVKVYTVSRTSPYCSGVYNYPYPIYVYPRPGAEIKWTPDKPTTFDDVEFIPNWKSGKPESFKWEFIGGVIPNDTAKPVAPDTSVNRSPVRHYPNFGKYPVMLVSKTDMGCIDTVAVFVDIIDGLQVFVPNTFTPNDDGINDFFMVKGIGIKPEGFSMDIFDRAGKVVFSTKDLEEAWDGKVGGRVLKDATYTYKIRVVGMNGEGRKEIIGHVNILK